MVQRQELQRDSSLFQLTHKREHYEREAFKMNPITGIRNPPAPERHRLFVYGTLKTHYGNNHRLRGAQCVFLGSTSVKGFVMLCNQSFPAVVPAPDKEWLVRGELYEIDLATLESCDRLEGVPNFYQRIEVDLEESDGRAWIYVRPVELLKEGTNFIPRGIWFPNAPTFQWVPGLQPNCATINEVPRPQISGYPGHRANPMAQNQPPMLALPAPAAVPVVVSPVLQVGPGWEEAAQEEVA
jgi:gamma-glutamylcyclotransferase (GGCT)/AIG2-like uncharacterized protein YtfP